MDSSGWMTVVNVRFMQPCVSTSTRARTLQGGNSSSTITAAPDVGPTVSRWTGELILEVCVRDWLCVYVLPSSTGASLTTCVVDGWDACVRGRGSAIWFAALRV
jgi:hypothetical protein